MRHFFNIAQIRNIDNQELHTFQIERIFRGIVQSTVESLRHLLGDLQSKCEKSPIPTDPGIRAMQRTGAPREPKIAFLEYQKKSP
ncbi:hypothetical protein D3C78_1533990 [compost metagenome]